MLKVKSTVLLLITPPKHINEMKNEALKKNSAKNVY